MASRLIPSGELEFVLVLALAVTAVDAASPITSACAKALTLECALLVNLRSTQSADEYREEKNHDRIETPGLTMTTKPKATIAFSMIGL